MKMLVSFSQLFLRIALGAAYLAFGLDRLGIWGKAGQHNVSWGDWQHFKKYASEVMNFLPYSIAGIFAITATIAEISFGALLIIGKWTKYAAIGSGLLSLMFAISMSISFGIVQPLSYSVFTVSAASFLLATLQKYKWSIDDGFAPKS